MVHAPQQFDLPEDPLGVDLVLESLGDLFYRHLLIVVRVQSGNHDAVG